MLDKTWAIRRLEHADDLKCVQLARALKSACRRGLGASTLPVPGRWTNKRDREASGPRDAAWTSE